MTTLSAGFLNWYHGYYAQDFPHLGDISLWNLSALPSLIISITMTLLVTLTPMIGIKVWFLWVFCQLPSLSWVLLVKSFSITCTGYWLYLIALDILWFYNMMQSQDVSLSIAFKWPLNNFDWYLKVNKIDLKLLPGAILLFLAFVINYLQNLSPNQINFHKATLKQFLKAFHCFSPSCTFFQETHLATIHWVLRCFLTKIITSSTYRGSMK